VGAWLTHVLTGHYQYYGVPRNFRALEAANRRAEGYNPLCGDRLTVYAQVEDGRVASISFEGSGCAISKASASLMTEAVKGRTVDEAENISKADIVDELGGLPEKKWHCSLMVEDAIKAAIIDYRTRK
jgi:nitrogen fixation NifU-like protein